jgi:hypothetical protein
MCFQNSPNRSLIRVAQIKRLKQLVGYQDQGSLGPFAPRLGRPETGH